MATASGDVTGEEGSVRERRGDGVEAGVAAAAAVAVAGTSGESLPVPEHAAAALMSTISANRGETTRTRLETSITYLKLYHSPARLTLPRD